MSGTRIEHKRDPWAMYEHDEHGYYLVFSVSDDPSDRIYYEVPGVPVSAVCWRPLENGEPCRRKAWVLDRDSGYTVCFHHLRSQPREQVKVAGV